jgi:hypothetical protein
MAEQFSQKTQSLIGLQKEMPLPFSTIISQKDLNAEMVASREETEKMDFSTLYGMAIDQEWLVPTIQNNSFRLTTAPEKPLSEEELTPEVAKQLTNGLTDQRAIEDILKMARTSGVNMALKLADNYRNIQRNSETFADYGLKGALAVGLATMTDPAEIGGIAALTAGVTAVTGGLGTVPTAVAGGAVQTARGLKKAYNVSKALKVGAGLGALEAATVEGIRAKLRYDVDGGDVMLAALLGGTVGGGLNAATVAFSKRAKVKNLARRNAIGDELSADELEFLEANDGDALTERMIDEAEARNDFEEPEARGDFDEEAEKTVQQRGKFKELRAKNSSFVRAKKSENKFTRLAADMQGLNSTGNVDGSAVRFSASERKTNIEMSYRTQFDRLMNYSRKEWRNETGGKVQDFNVLVSRAVRGIDPNPHPSVKQVADYVENSFNKLAKEAVDANVAGFTRDTFKDMPNYLPRLFNYDKIDSLRTKLGRTDDSAFERLIEKAIRQGQPQIATTVRKALTEAGNEAVTDADIDDFIKRMAKGYTRTVIRNDLPKGHAGRGVEFNVEDLQAIMKTEGFSDTDIDIIVDSLTRTTTVKGHKRARPRVVLDESASIDIEIDGEIQKLRFYDLLEEDIENLNSAYIFQMSGAIGLAKNGINTNDLGSSMENLLRKMDDEYDRLGTDKALREREVQAVKFMYDGITGRLGFDDAVPTSTRNGLRRMREYGFATYMGMSGMSALMEISNAVLEYSIPVLLRNTPRLGGLIRKARNGQLDDALMRELEVMSGLGGDVITGKTTRSTRYEGILADSPYKGDYDKWDEGLGKLRETTALLSGLSTVTAGLRRLSMLNYATTWARSQRKGKLPFSEIKMEQLGISTKSVDGKPSMAKRIQEQIASKSTFRNQKTLVSLNVAEWTDKEAAEIFQLSVFREATQNVQEVNIGSVSPFMRSEVGKTFFQFLSFTLASVEQQTMRLGVRFAKGDAATVSKVMLGAVFMGYMMYTARVNLNAAGRSDREDYLEERFSDLNLAKGIFQQVGAASIFQYIMEITTGAMAGNTNAITPPALSLVTNGFSTAANLFEGQLTETEWRQLTRLIPLSSLYGVRQILNGLSQEAARFTD